MSKATAQELHELTRGYEFTLEDAIRVSQKTNKFFVFKHNKVYFGHNPR